MRRKLPDLLPILGIMAVIALVALGVYHLDPASQKYHPATSERVHG